jgi:hypothetical protein
MAAEDRMTVDERRRYLKRMHGRHWVADRKGRSASIDEIVAYTELHRKYVIQLLRKDWLDRKPRKTKRGRTYGVEVEYANLRPAPPCPIRGSCPRRHGPQRGRF